MLHVCVMTHLDVCLINFIEKVFNSILILHIMQHEKTSLASCHKGRNEPLVKLVNNF